MPTNNQTASSDPRDTFLSLLSTALQQKTFAKMTLGKYRGSEPELQNIYVKGVSLKGEDVLSFVWRYRTRDITKNLPIPEGVQMVAELLGSTFKSGNLFTSAGDASIEFSKKGKALFRQSKGSHVPTVSATHDREKERLLDPTLPFLHELGITDERGDIIPSMSRKWKQMDKFLQIFSHALQSSGVAGTDEFPANEFHVVDFGSGKGYLTFAVHDYLRRTLGAAAHVTGVELRPELVDFCNGVVERLGIEGLQFYPGDIRNFAPGKIDVMIALHACDIATDLAMYKGISSGARIIMSAPCCHKEVRPQMKSPELLQPLLRHGVHLGQEAEMVTDGLRALLLEAHGYRTQVFEFVSLEHTSKNKMILAVKEPNVEKREEIGEQIAKIKEFYGIEHQALEELLKGEA